MNNTQQWYYTDSNGSQAGPISSDELRQLVSTGAVTTHSMVWTEGMDDWSLASQVDGLFPAPSPTVPKPTAASPAASPASQATNPYEPPQSFQESSPLSTSHQSDLEYGGITRLPYFLRMLAYVFLGVMAIFLITFSGRGGALILIIAIVLLVVIIRLHCARLTNIGVSPWWVLLIFVPIISNIMNIILLACPTGFAQTKKLDTPGIIIAVVLGIFTLFSFYANLQRFTHFNFTIN